MTLTNSSFSLTVEKQKKELNERIKELNCLYSVSSLLVMRKYPLEDLLRKAVRYIPSGWQYPERTCVRILLNNHDVQTDNFKETTLHLKQNILVSNKPVGFLEVSYLNTEPGGRKVSAFLEGEKKLIAALAVLIGDIVERVQAEEVLENKTRELQKQKTELERKNIVLREVLAQIESDKKEIERQIYLNVENLIMPVLIKLKTASMPSQMYLSYLDLLSKNLTELMSSFGKNIISEKIRLSPREIEVCNLVRNGLTNKEIANMLGITPSTIERHRFNIRKKLGISGEKINLTTYLHEF